MAGTGREAQFHPGDPGANDQPGLTAPLAPIVREHREASPEGEVIKFVQSVGARADGTPLETESVLIPMIGKLGQHTYTLCLSSQVGCAMGCTFCETAQMGLIRSLAAEEIVGQWFAAAHALGIRPKNLVFMGMGEPMHNLDNVIAAIQRIAGPEMGSLGWRQVTVSTVGVVPGIDRLGDAHNACWGGGTCRCHVSGARRQHGVKRPICSNDREYLPER